MFVTWHSYVFANGCGLILLQALFPSQFIFEKPRILFGHSCISFIVSICMGNYYISFLFLRYCACIEQHDIPIYFDVI